MPPGSAPKDTFQETLDDRNESVARDRERQQSRKLERMSIGLRFSASSRR